MYEPEYRASAIPRLNRNDTRPHLTENSQEDSSRRMSYPSENPVYDAVLAYQKTAALTAAIKLDIFTLIGAGMMTAEDLASRAGASVRGLRILCDYLTVI